MNLDLKMSSFNFKALVRDTAKQNLMHAKEADVLLLLAIDSRIPEQLIGDKARLKPLISYFIINGINQCRQQGTCTVMAALVNESKDVFRVRFAVRDDGKGLSPEEYMELYNPLRSTSAAPVSLHPFKLIVEAHRGSIDVASSSAGNEFSFEIPFKLSNEAFANVEVLNKSFNATPIPPPKKSQEDASLEWIASKAFKQVRKKYDSGAANVKSFETNAIKARKNPKSLPHINGKIDSVKPSPATSSVLVVDDVLSNRMMTGRVLERFGFAVDYAEDGRIAVDKCKDKLYALIIMDNMMPVLTGKEATKMLREQNYWGLVVGLTGNVLDEDLEEFRESGCDEVITKPLDVPELRRTLISLGLSIPKTEHSL